MKVLQKILLTSLVLCAVLAAGSGALAVDVQVDTQDVQTVQEDAAQPETAQQDQNQNQDTEEEHTATTQSTEVKEYGTLRILAIGNSFTNDTMRYVCRIAESAGYDVTIGVLWRSSTSLQEHVDYCTSDSAVYDYQKFSRSSDGEMVNRTDVTAKSVMKDENWDLVFLQQSSYYNGVPSSFEDERGNSYLEQIVSFVKSQVRNLKISFAWLMGWAYAEDYSSERYTEYYNGDQMTMYEAISDTLQNTILPTGLFDLVIPVGTSVQNVRSSYVGDNLNRDGKHLTYSMGRYVASLTVAASIGIDVDHVNYWPSGNINVCSLHMPMMVSAVNSAVSTPFAVTRSDYQTAPKTSKPSVGELKNKKAGVSIEWSGVKAAASYQIYRKTSTGSWKKIDEVSQTGDDDQYSYTDTTAANAQGYYYKIYAKFDSNLSKKASSSTYVVRLQSPNSIKTVSSSSKKITVKWEKNKGATQYQIRYSRSKSMTNATTVSVNASVLKKTLTGLRSNKTYYIQVRCRNKTDGHLYSSVWSSIYTCKTP